MSDKILWAIELLLCPKSNHTSHNSLNSEEQVHVLDLALSKNSSHSTKQKHRASQAQGSTTVDQVAPRKFGSRSSRLGNTSRRLVFYKTLALSLIHFTKHILSGWFRFQFHQRIICFRSPRKKNICLTSNSCLCAHHSSLITVIQPCEYSVKQSDVKTIVLLMTMLALPGSCLQLQ